MSPEGAAGPSGSELAGLGLLLAVVILAPLVGGALLDRALHTGSLFLLVGLFVGIAGTVAVVYTRYVKRFL
jgi:nitrate/nitrite transporter NarK